MEAALDRLVELGASKEELLYMSTATENEHQLAHIHMISMAMTVQAMGLDWKDYPEVSKYQWDAHSESTHFDWSAVYDTGLHYTTREYDFRLDSEHLRQVARSILFDAKFDQDEEKVKQPVRAFRELLDKRSQNTLDQASAQVLGFITASTGIYIGLLVCFVCVLLATRSLRLVDYKVLLICFSAILVVVAVLVMLLSMVALKDERLSRATFQEDARKLAREERMQSAELTSQVRHFVQFGNAKAYNNFWQIMKGPRWQGIIDDFTALGLTVEEQKLLEDSHHKAEDIRRVQEISMLLVIWSFRLNPHLFPDVESRQWDLEAEPDMDEQKLAYPTRRYWYSSRANDIKLPVLLQRAMARWFLFDNKYAVDSARMNGLMTEMVESIDQRSNARKIAVQSSIDLMAYALIGSTVLFIAMSVGTL